MTYAQKILGIANTEMPAFNRLDLTKISERRLKSIYKAVTASNHVDGRKLWAIDMELHRRNPAKHRAPISVRTLCH